MVVYIIKLTRSLPAFPHLLPTRMQGRPGNETMAMHTIFLVMVSILSMLCRISWINYIQNLYLTPASPLIAMMGSW